MQGKWTQVFVLLSCVLQKKECFYILNELLYTTPWPFPCNVFSIQVPFSPLCPSTPKMFKMAYLRKLSSYPLDILSFSQIIFHHFSLFSLLKICLLGSCQARANNRDLHVFIYQVNIITKGSYNKGNICMLPHRLDSSSLSSKRN